VDGDLKVNISSVEIHPSKPVKLESAWIDHCARFESPLIVSDRTVDCDSRGSRMQGISNDGMPSPTADGTNGGITIPSLNGAIGHIRQKPSRVGLGERQYSYDVNTGPSVRVVPKSNPSPPPLHHRQYSEGGGGEKQPSAHVNGGRNASVSTIDTSQPFNGTSDSVGPPLSGGRRRHGHGHSHAHSHHHHPSHAGTLPGKPASMMSIAPPQ